MHWPYWIEPDGSGVFEAYALIGGLICIILVVLIIVYIRHIFTRENTKLDRVIVKLQRRVYGNPFFF